MLNPSFIHDIRDFGAVGDGDHLNTIAVQKAIDTCHECGGGIVSVPPGLFRTGSIVLKSHVELRLESGATLLGSADRADYVQHRRADPELDPTNRAHNHFCNLIHAHDADGVSITGSGTIDVKRNSQELKIYEKKMFKNPRFVEYYLQ